MREAEDGSVRTIAANRVALRDGPHDVGAMYSVMAFGSIKERSMRRGFILRLSFVASSVIWLGLGGVSGVAGQRPTLTPDDYGQWERLGAFQLDPTGRWLVVSLTRIDGETELRLHRADGSGEALSLPYGRAPEFTADGRWLVYRKGVSADEAADAEERIEDRLGLVDLKAGRDSVHFDVRAISPRDDGVWIAGLGVPAADTVGADLIILNPATGAQTSIGNVDEFAWQEGGRHLAATLRTAWGTANGVVLFDPESGTLRTIESGDADYRSLTWHEDSAQLAVLRAVEDESREEPTHDVLIWSDVTSSVVPQVLDALSVIELGLDYRLTDYAGVSFSEDGQTVFVGVRPWVSRQGDEMEGDEREVVDGGELEEREAVEPADVQVWHWDDDQIMRAQEYGADRISRQTLLAAWHRSTDHFVLLGDDLNEPVRIVAGGTWGIVPDFDPYLFERRFGAGTADWYRVDPVRGERTLFVRGAEFGIQTHGDLNRALFYQRDRWNVVDLASLEIAEIAGGGDFTQSLTDFDYPGPRPSWGLGGWSTDGDVAYVYDRHDVWRVDLRQGAATRMTDGATSGERFRLVNLDPDQPRFGLTLVDEGGELVLSVLHLRTKSSGYVGIDGHGREQWSMRREARVGGLTKAADADRLAFRLERWDDSPDVFVADDELDDALQITNTNAFQSDFAWGRSELLDYSTDAGHDLQAVLIYPAGFEQGRTYPLILYQYERLSHNLHIYNAPSEREYYNYQAWSQAGYFVLMPDIVYEPGRPGPSALDAIEHALDAALATGYVNADAMGLIGHSWGGYQASYPPTRTDRFAASVAGAAITNFMSFMGAVHWNGGLPETGHWETGQARMARPYWEDLEGHLESSPANFIADLDTPMLLMHGDADGVVDFYQGLEFYNYARRAGKEVVLLVYPGADHGLREETQQVDYHRRILEWFGHYLKGEAAGDWITRGESWVERGRRIGR